MSLEDRSKDSPHVCPEIVPELAERGRIGIDEAAVVVGLLNVAVIAVVHFTEIWVSCSIPNSRYGDEKRVLLGR